MVGDSQAHAFGCALGDDLFGNGGPCPSVPGFSTINQTIGACTTWGTAVSLYNGGQAGVPNCGPVPGGFENLTWPQMADKYVPNVVVISASGWETVDHWIQCPPFCGNPPDAWWGGNGQPTADAAGLYRDTLVSMINQFLFRGAQVLVANAPYADPPEPVPPISEVGPDLGCSWWEPNDPNAPQSAGPNCNGNAQQGSGGSWRSPHGVGYVSSHTKLEQLNGVINGAVQGFGSGVRLFNTARHFNFGGDYTSLVCPPPNDGVVAPDQNNQCPNGPAVVARGPDNSHMSPAGMFQVLKPYLVDCVEGMLGISGGNLNACT